MKSISRSTKKSVILVFIVLATFFCLGHPEVQAGWLSNMWNSTISPKNKCKLIYSATKSEIVYIIDSSKGTITYTREYDSKINYIIDCSELQEIVKINPLKSSVIIAAAAVGAGALIISTGGGALAVFAGAAIGGGATKFKIKNNDKDTYCH